MIKRPGETEDALGPRFLLRRPAKAHLLKPVGAEAEFMAVAYVDGAVVLVDAYGRTLCVETGTDVIDIALLSAGDLGFMALATPESAVACSFEWTNLSNDSITRAAKRLGGHDGRVTGVAAFPGVADRALSGSASARGRVEEAQLLHPCVVSADERGNVHRWGDRGLHHLGTSLVHRKTVHFIHASTTRDNRRIFVTASDDRDILLHDFDSGQIYARLNAHVGWIEQILPVESAGVLRYLVVVDRVGTMIWDVQDQRVISRFRGRPRMDVAVSHAPNRIGLVVAAGTDEGVIVARENRVRRFQPVADRMIRAVSLCAGTEGLILWVGAEDRLYRFDGEGCLIEASHQFPANILRLKAWSDGTRMIGSLEDGSIWMMEC